MVYEVLFTQRTLIEYREGWFLEFSWFYEVLFTQRTLIEYREGWFFGFWSFYGFMKFCSLKELW